MKKIIALLSTCLLFSTANAFVDGFKVNIKPTPVEINSPATMTIKAVDSDGNVEKNYTGSIIMDIGNNISTDVERPNDGLYEFKKEDQGTVTFDKGLTFRQTSKSTDSGKFDIEVFSLTDESIKGSKSIKVVESGDKEKDWNAEITSPAEGGEASGEDVNVIGNSNVPNSPFEVVANGKVVSEDITNENGGFNTYVSDLSTGDIKLYVNIKDANGQTLAKSDTVNFKYKGEGNNKALNNFDIKPSNTVMKNEEITFEVDTAEKVDSVEVNVKGLSTFIIDEKTDGIFTKTISIKKTGKYDVALELFFNDGTSKVKEGYELTIKEKNAINNLRYERTKNPKGVSFQWESSGSNIKKYKIVYGQTGSKTNNGNNMTNTGIVKDNKYLLTGLNKEKDYNFQVIGLNKEGEPVGEPSKKVLLEAGVRESASLCKVEDIQISTMQTGGNNYITWDEVKGANKYEIFRSDEKQESIENMQKIGETEETKFEYPFDDEAEKVMYDYYSVRANCDNGNNAQVGKVKGIQVGPVANFIMFLLFSLFVYLIFKLYGYTRV